MTPRSSAFSTVFLYPFAFRGDPRNSDLPWVLADTADEDLYERLYFHKYMRHLFYGTAESGPIRPIKTYEVRGIDVAHSRMEIRVRDADGASELSQELRSLHIFEFHPRFRSEHASQLGVLAIEVSDSVPAGSATSPGGESGPLLGDALAFNNLARLMCQAYATQAERGGMPEETRLRIKLISEAEDRLISACCEPPRIGADGVVSGAKRAALAPTTGQALLTGGIAAQILAPRYGKTRNALDDDRMFVHSYLRVSSDDLADTSVLDDEARLAARDTLFLRAMYVDPYGEGYAYARDFITPLAERTIYRRWDFRNPVGEGRHEGPPADNWTLYGYTRYSSMCLTASSDECLRQYHLSMYLKMVVLALFYRARLINFAEEVREATDRLFDKPGTRNRSRFADLHRQFIEFNNIYWYDEVSNQEQGVELFRLMIRALDIERLHHQVSDDIRHADEFLTGQDAEDLNRYGAIFALFGLAAAFVGVFVGAFGMNVNPFVGWNWLNMPGRESPHFWLLLLVWMAACAALVCLLWWGLRRKRR